MNDSRYECDDNALVEAAKAGDQTALNRLLVTHYNRIYAICLRLTDNEADGQDAAQEALIAIVKGLSRFEGRAKFSTWAYRIATNAALAELRKRGRRPFVGLPEQQPLEPITGVGKKIADPADVVTTHLQLDKALSELPEIFRTAVVLRDVGGFSYDDIGAILKIPLGTVRSRIARGRRHLAKNLLSSE